jgi:hypothetical protein
MNLRISPEIFRVLMGGHMINQAVYNVKSNEFISNPLYEEISGHFKEYENVYLAIGFELMAMGNAYFIRENGLNTYDDNAMQEMVLLDCINRGLTLMGSNPHILRDKNLGVPFSQLEEIGTKPEIQMVMSGCGFKQPFKSCIDNSLVSRSIAYKVGDKLVLSDAGQAFLDELIDQVRIIANVNTQFCVA